MNVLTDEDAKEIHRVLCATVGADYLTIAKAASDFTIKKLAAGVSVEPAATMQTYPDGRRRVLLKGSVADCDAQWQTTHILYTATAIAAARVQENERCARTLEAIGCQGYADALRALLGKEQS